MTPKARQRVMRNFLAALLQSDLTTGELEDLARELSQGTIAFDLSNLVREAMFNLAETGHTKLYTESSTEKIAQVYNTIVNRRFSKKAVADLMKIASPGLSSKHFVTLPNKTLREMINWYFNEVAPDEFNKFASIAAGGSSDDYLAGIGNKT